MVDSGGYNLKTGGGSMIELMKFDMGGTCLTVCPAPVMNESFHPCQFVNEDRHTLSNHMSMDTRRVIDSSHCVVR